MPKPTQIISAAINEALASDAANRNYLRTLGEARIDVQSESPETSIFIQILDGEVSVHKSAADDETVGDIRISGTALDLAKLLLQPVDNAAQLRHANVRVEGDVALLLELAQISKNIEVDWDAMLAERIGEAPAVVLGRGLRTAKESSKKVFESQKAALEGWLKTSDSPLPNREDYEQLKTNLRQLHYRLDRLDAQLKQKQGLAPSTES